MRVLKAASDLIFSSLIIFFTSSLIGSPELIVAIGTSLQILSIRLSDAAPVKTFISVELSYTRLNFVASPEYK